MKKRSLFQTALGIDYIICNQRNKEGFLLLYCHPLVVTGKYNPSKNALDFEGMT